MEWMGHKRIDETMGYVHVVERKPRPIPSELVEIGMKEIDPTQRVLKQLAARAKKMTNFGEGQQSSETMSAG